MPGPATEQFDIVVIGYGPTGAVLANLLGAAGLSVLVLEREAVAYHLPRAIHFDAEIMRLFQTIGLADRIEPVTADHPGMRFVDADGKLLLDWPRQMDAGPQGWRGSYRFHQPELEDILRGGVERYPNVLVRSRADAFFVEDCGDYARVRYEDMARGRIHHVEARYVVGCDGARSTVRRFIETGMEDLGFHERWLVVDVILNRPDPRFDFWSIQHCDPARPSTYVPTPGLRRRWELTVLPDEDSNAVTAPDKVWDLLSRWITPQEARLERAAVYTFHSLIADRWRAGRLLLAGDACHQTPPFMGQGMCAGLRDVANLGWKLIEAVSAPDDVARELVDSYESERRPNVHTYIATAVRLGGLINNMGREAALNSADSHVDGVAKMESVISVLGDGLGKGPNAGKLFPQPRLADSRMMDDAIGYRPALLGLDTALAGRTLPEGLAVLTEIDIPELPSLLAGYDAVAVLIRPDRYIMVTAKDAVEISDMLAAGMRFLETRQPEAARHRETG